MYSRIWIVLVLGTLLVLSAYTLMELRGEDVRADPAVYTRRGVGETGAVNMVTAILFDYRSFDTLGEATVIFAAATILALFAPRRRVSMFGVEFSLLVRCGVALILPFIMLFGFYVTLFGHISPGGGFTGGVLLASTTIIFALTYSVGNRRSYLVQPIYAKFVENMGLLLFLGTGLVGIGLGGFFLANAPTGIGLGQPGRFVSGGWIPLLNLASGLKVGAGLGIIFTSLAKEE